MRIKYLEEEDIVNYGRAVSMFIGTAYCDFKCEKENPLCCCQNSLLAKTTTKEIKDEDIIKKFDNNCFIDAIVFGGLEPFLQFEELIEFIKKFRINHRNTIIIYTGYYKEEIQDKIEKLKPYKNIIVKFGRFIPNQNKHYDDILGVYLASDNQYAEKIC